MIWGLYIIIIFIASVFLLFRYVFNSIKQHREADNGKPNERHS